VKHKFCFWIAQGKNNEEIGTFSVRPQHDQKHVLHMLENSAWKAATAAIRAIEILSVPETPPDIAMNFSWVSSVGMDIICKQPTGPQREKGEIAPIKRKKVSLRDLRIYDREIAVRRGSAA